MEIKETSTAKQDSRRAIKCEKQEFWYALVTKHFFFLFCISTGTSQYWCYENHRSVEWARIIEWLPRPFQLNNFFYEIPFPLCE